MRIRIKTLSVAVAIASGAVGGSLVTSHVLGKEPRFPQLTLEQLNDSQRPLGDEIMKVSSVGLGGPYNPMLRSPDYGQKMYDLLYYLRWKTSVPIKLNEFAILIVGRHGDPRSNGSRMRRWRSRPASRQRSSPI
jgi:4-carboxymuconolactone decarboxylase